MIFFKKFQDFILEQPLNEMFSFFDMVQFYCYNKIKSMLPGHKIKMEVYYVKNKAAILIFWLGNNVFIFI
jgi:hypothetical protein